MEYIQGFAKTHYYEFNMNFTAVVCDNVRYSNIDNIYDYDKNFDINFSKGDIMCVKFFKANEFSKTAYTYLEGYYNSSGVYIEVNQETIMSREFVSTNSEGLGGKLLVDVTKKINRDKKINLILEYGL